MLISHARVLVCTMSAVAALLACNEANFQGGSTPIPATAPAAQTPLPASANAVASATPAPHPASLPVPPANQTALGPADAKPQTPPSATATGSAVATATAVAVDSGIPQPPREGCQAFVTGLILSDVAEGEISRVYQVDAGSELVGSGRYASNAASFPKANAATFDGIALDPGTHMVVYAGRNFQGAVVFEASGPLVLNNIQKSNDFPEYFTTVMEDWDPVLQAKFPQATRKLSQTDMVQWGLTGSSVVTCD